MCCDVRRPERSWSVDLRTYVVPMNADGSRAPREASMIQTLLCADIAHGSGGRLRILCVCSQCAAGICCCEHLCTRVGEANMHVAEY